MQKFPAYFSRSLLSLIIGLFLTVSQAFALDVNKADLEDLQTVEGVGPVIAKRIIDERRRGGNFSSREDLISRVKGVGDKTAQRITSGSGLRKGTSNTKSAKTNSKKSSSTKTASSSKTASSTKTASAKKTTTKTADTKKKSSKKDTKKTASKSSSKKSSTKKKAAKKKTTKKKSSSKSGS